ncbi:CaiB/BaiF CoA transferase family protein [Desulfosoma caldarium]|uniref:Crotonobetainyl-CoA:carnitine CoA-transferase CaiB-like acyl-CoA transferase n=1 Tax=Desulfosoma caldarium TaxID=610254 RepID=A0A3N1UWV4_9BACT|nr:CoA transferase [Desulfosoma caldarium]ROQ93170.1 crotonobetainyl-CoA:carnitine CoA-transferase CaiB-like acyl-CoA transferase [Desulfosoma caldarium]
MNETTTTWFDWAKAHSDPCQAAQHPEALDNLLVLDLSYMSFGGLVASSILAELGARVLRIEPPEGDPARHFSPFGLTHQDTGLAYLVEGRNKHHITLDLEEEEGRDIFTKLVAHADIVIETFEPGFLDALGIGYRHLRDLQPRLIYAALHTYGQFGPKARQGRQASEIANQAYSGLIHINGEPEDAQRSAHAVPTKVGSWYGWYAEGLFAAYGILAALLYRERSGKGQMVDVSGAECIMKFIDYNMGWYHMGGGVKERLGNYDPSVFPYTFIQCKDGYTFLAAYNDEAFATLMEIIGRPELTQDPRFSTFMQRTSYESEEALQQILEEWSLQYTVDEVIHMVAEATAKKEGRAAAVVTGKVCRPSQTFAEQNWWDRGVFQKIHDPVYGDLALQGPVWKMTGTPPRLKWACRPVGADNEAVYGRLLGLGHSQLERLRASGVI